MKIKYYKTYWEDEKNPERRCRFAMLSELIDADVGNYPGLKPRLMHIADQFLDGFVWVVAIVVWE